MRRQFLDNPKTHFPKGIGFPAFFLGACLTATGCPPSSSIPEDRPPTSAKVEQSPACPSPSTRVLVPRVIDPESVDSVLLDTVYVGMVGKAINTPLVVKKIVTRSPMQMVCRVGYRQVTWTSSAAHEPPPLNFSIRGAECSEGGIIRGRPEKTLNCKMTTGGAEIRVEPGDSDAILAFGLYCSRKGDLAPRVQPAPAQAPAATPAPPAADPPAAALVKQLRSSGDGSSDKFTRLSLKPCKEPLLTDKARGVVTIGSSSIRRQFVVTKSETCDIEVRDVPEDILEPNIKIQLFK